MTEPLLTIKQINNNPLTFEAKIVGNNITLIGEEELVLILKIINSKSVE